jgi:hypothetical protein
MFKLIEFLIYGCWHKWVSYHEISVHDVHYMYKVGTHLISRCEKCSRMKRFKLRA